MPQDSRLQSFATDPSSLQNGKTPLSGQSVWLERRRALFDKRRQSWHLFFIKVLTELLYRS